MIKKSLAEVPLYKRFNVGDLLKMTPKQDDDIPDFSSEPEYGIYVGGTKDDIDSEFDYIRVYEFKSGTVWKYDEYWDIELLDKNNKKREEKE